MGKELSGGKENLTVKLLKSELRLVLLPLSSRAYPGLISRTTSRPGYISEPEAVLSHAVWEKGGMLAGGIKDRDKLSEDH